MNSSKENQRNHFIEKIEEEEIVIQAEDENIFEDEGYESFSKGD